MKLSAETPIPDIDKPTPPEKDICWYVNDIKCCKDSFRCLEQICDVSQNAYCIDGD